MSLEVRTQEFIDAARPYYDDRLQYHGWSHVEALLDGIDEYIDVLDERGYHIARHAVKVALAWHDADFFEDHIALGFKTKEHLSADRARQYLEGKADESEIILVEDIILGTIHGAPRELPEILLGHRRDVANIGQTYDIFFNNTVKLWHEAQMLGGRKITWQEWIQSSSKFIEFTIAEAQRELPRLSEPVGVPGAYDVIATENLRRLLLESEPV